eukprot:3831688-Alexandrium_andersonii.AAC.1
MARPQSGEPVCQQQQQHHMLLPAAVQDAHEGASVRGAERLRHLHSEAPASADTSTWGRRQ